MNDPSPRPDLHDLRDAAVAAEFQTGKREGSAAEAKRNIVVRLARMTFGFLLFVAGIVMIPLPGPGFLVVAIGLAILAEDVAWADRVLRIVRRRVPGLDEDGPIPRSALLVGLTIGLAVTAASLWLVFR